MGAATIRKDRARLVRLLGELPPRGRPIRARRLGEEARPGYVLERWRLDLNGVEPVPALVARPRGAKGRLPAVLYNHAHFGDYALGKRELVEGRGELQAPPYADALCAEGYVVLAIDHWCFGERAHASELDTFKAMLWRGQVMWGMMVSDSLRALDFLAARRDVDARRLATLGMSMGSTMAWWLAALDPRVKVTADLCCQTDFAALLARKRLHEHGIYYYVPGLLREFSTARIEALIAPRAHLACAGLRDPLTPPEGLRRIDRELRRVYARHGHPERWRLLSEDVGHVETPAARRAILAFLREHL